MSDVLEALGSALADHYRIERELGAGGMATVYLAHDLRHDRDVAIKVLHPDLGAVLGSERFLSEIKTTAKLQHPHILPLLDSGAAEGLLFYVMPLVTGETLRARLQRERQLPLDDAVLFSREVADALGYAHGVGVIHRDIKPENILLQGGHALVADFGIALAVEQAGGGRMTQTGLSLGTPQYMSPEQAMGERVIDARSDIYSLGAVTYEMLVGEPPFTGPSVQAIVARLVTEEPRRISTQRKAVPPGVEAAVMRALEKLPADRFATAGAFAEALSNPGYAATGVSRPAKLSAARGRRGLWLAIAVGLVCIAAGVGTGWALWHSRTSPLPPAILRYALTVPDSAPFAYVIGTGMASAPDGSVAAYPTRYGVMLRYADRLDAVPAPGGLRARDGAFFSPDGAWFGYVDDGKLMKAPLAGGAPVPICDVCDGYEFSWGTDDSIRFHRAPPDDPNTRVLMVVSPHGGRPHEFARPAAGSGEAFRSPILLPGTRTVLFGLFTGTSSRLAALDLRTGAITRFDQAGSTPQWVDAGFVVMGNADGTLLALPFDAARGRPTGPPVTIARDLFHPDPYATQAAVSRNGSILYVQSGVSTPRPLLAVSRSGTVTVLSTEPNLFESPRFAPDGRRIALDITTPTGNSRDVWVLDVTQHAWSRLTTNGISDRPIWTPDGRRLIYSSNADLWTIAADGSGRPDSFLVAPGARYGGGITPDGRTVIFDESGSSTSGIRSVALDSAAPPRTILTGTFGESSPALSPDGYWLAYQSDEGGQSDVYVRPFPGAGARISVSLHGGTEPVWAHSGRELFYRSGDSLMSATVSLSPGFAVTGRRLLFTGSFLRGNSVREYDVSPDDQQFVMIGGGGRNARLIALHGVFARMVYDREHR